MVARVLRWLLTKKRVYEAKRVRAGGVQDADGLFRRTPKGANTPWKGAETVCFYGAALRAATPACVAGRWTSLFFRIARRTVGA